MWSWRFEDGAGRQVSAGSLDGQEFASQADAETWLGEVWRDLQEQQVAAVTLLEDGREVYGPMSLSAS